MHETERCFHCNETIPPGTEINLVVDGLSQPMCCHGCEAVCKTILDSGLQDYYRFRTANAETPDTNQDDLQMYDVPEVIETFSVNTGSLWQSRLSVGGLHCAACAWLIENQLASLTGVESINVHLQNHIVTVSWDDTAIRISEIIKAIHELGYSATPYSASSSQKLLQQQSDALLGRLGIAGIGMMQVVMVAIALYAGEFQDISQSMRNLLRYFSLAVTTPVLFYSAQPFFAGAIRNFRTLKLGMDVPVTIALVAAYIASVIATVHEDPHVYYDTINMFVFFLLLSRYLQLLAQRPQSNGAGVLPVTARVVDDNNPGDSQWVAASLITPGNTVMVQPGEVIPVDGTVISGKSSVNESSFTGEFKPRAISAGDEVMAGTHNIDGNLLFRASSKPAASKISFIDHLLEQALLSKPQVALIADRIAEKFVLIVLLVSAATFTYWQINLAENAFVVTLAVLVVSCPCALSLATPTTYTAAINGLRKCGIVVADAEVFEHAHKVSHAIFDKTGTLTVGKPQLDSINILGAHTKPEILRIAASLERHSNHPIAKAFENQTDITTANNISVTSGQGIEGTIGGDVWRIGTAGYCAVNEHLFDSPARHGKPAGADDNQIVIYLARNKQAVAQLTLVDAIRPGASVLLEQLHESGMQVHILSGDRVTNVAEVASKLGVSDYHGRCTAEDKLQFIKKLQQQGKTVLMVGDGVNDAPVIAGADISVAMTNASELTRAQADVCLLSEDLGSLQQLLDKASTTRKILLQNFGWALGYNLLALPLAAMGYIPPYLAALGMSASSILVVFNAARAGKTGLSKSTSQVRPQQWPLAEGGIANG